MASSFSFSASSPSFAAHLRAINRYNWQTLRSAPLAEISGALGDLGTLLPLMIALALGGSIDLGSTLVFTGLVNILTGVVYGVPLPVQPMKAIAAVAIAQHFTLAETAAAGLTMGIAVLVLSITGLLHHLTRVVPVPVVKGIQVGAGLSLVISAGTTLIQPLSWTGPSPWDNRIWAIAAFVFLVIANRFRRIPYALLVFIFGLIIAASTSSHPSSDTLPTPSSTFQIWHPHTLIPSKDSWRRGAVDAAIPQLPLTVLNSILAVSSLAATLFPAGYPPVPSTTSLGFSIGIANFIACWFGAMPICHGSGGLAGQYRFGARSGASIILLGTAKLLLGLCGFGDALVPLLKRFPAALLGVMVLAAGVELAKVAQTVGTGGMEIGDADGEDDGRDRRDEAWIVMLVTASGCLALKNDAVGFIAGLVWFWGLRAPMWVRRWTGAGKSVRLRGGEEGLRGEEGGSGEGLLSGR